MGMHMWHCLFHMLSGPGKNIEFMRRTKVLIPLPPLSVTIELKKKKNLNCSVELWRNGYASAIYQVVMGDCL